MQQCSGHHCTFIFARLPGPKCLPFPEIADCPRVQLTVASQLLIFYANIFAKTSSLILSSSNASRKTISLVQQQTASAAARNTLIIRFGKISKCFQISFTVKHTAFVNFLSCQPNLSKR